ncbi:MAG TPA: response regulator transcription factor [Propioniciclava tarda]|nr:response regulator transcription factor [Propioniciclava tarda]HQA30078.1 response regulator transcription factor [Propioniciclava tarda]HQD59812.1 response regulator transcription factor [Propioniciclava tarda]
MDFTVCRAPQGGDVATLTTRKLAVLAGSPRAAREPRTRPSRASGAGGSCAALAPCRVMVVSEHRPTRAILANALAAQADFITVSPAESCVAALTQAVLSRPDIVLIEIEDALAVIDDVIAIRDRLPACRVVLWTSDATDDGLVTAIRAGVHGYLLRDMPIPEMLDSLRSVRDKGNSLSSTLIGRLFEAVRASAAPRSTAPGLDELSEREKEIMRWVAAGLTNREIGQRLFITEGTVKNHVHSTLRKLGVSDRSTAALIVAGGLAGQR